MGMIVKIQAPLATNEPDPQYLVYDEEKTFRLFYPVGVDDRLDALMAIEEDMTGVPKLYMRAHLDLDGILHLDERIDQQDW